MLEQIRRICALHEASLIDDAGLIRALDRAARDRRPPAPRRR